MIDTATSGPGGPAASHPFGRGPAARGPAARGYGLGSSARFGARRWAVVLGGLLLPALIFAVWQIGTTTGLINTSQLPSPVMVWEAGVDLFDRGLLTLYVAISTQRVLIGFAIGASLGLVVGAFVGLSRAADILLGPTLGAIRAVPSLAWVPLLLLWLGIQEDSKLTLIAIGAFFPVYTTVAQALRHVDAQLVEAGRAFGLSGVQLFLTVQLPAAVPTVISGLRLALAQSWLFLVAAELLAASMGLGFLLSESGGNGRIDRILLAIILLAVLGKLTDALVGILERWATRRWA
ncbi:ABC transporter permease [Glaciibacter psychrotolerans]|uniref:Sulfonate transport system permease protein n=1 Tax=Glaciibacter psychrotolerans TaxID=670054 RepID=A0A7Z0EGI2_9MICO|nr:ABC transporter permease [Leifsonia psychrotolerans]NYJ21221.1 sulfonate transport system permease protein [Leifsonia psychrotolerans]